VRKKNSKIGRPRKVIKQDNAHLSFTGKSVTSYAGMAMISRGIEHFNVRDHLKQSLCDFDGSTQYPTWRILEQLICLRTHDGDAITDINPLHDPALMAIFDWDAVAHPTTFGRRLGQI